MFENIAAVPHHVITMGIEAIMDSRICLLLAFGREKAEAVRNAVEGPVSTSTPASILQFHQRIKVILDEDAASELKRGDYYRWVYRNKPAWHFDEYKGRNGDMRQSYYLFGTPASPTTPSSSTRTTTAAPDG